MLPRAIRTLILLLPLSFVSSLSVQAQSTYGSVAGSVTDPSGAALVDAQVMLTNSGTSEKRTQSTVADGLYSFVTVIPGQYRIEVEKQGFKHVTREPVVVQVQQSTHIDVAMQVGMVSEVMTGNRRNAFAAVGNLVPGSGCRAAESQRTALERTQYFQLGCALSWGRSPGPV